MKIPDKDVKTIKKAQKYVSTLYTRYLKEGHLDMEWQV